MPLLLALLAGVAPTPTIVVAGERRPFAVAPLSARELAVLRGGLRLPNGLDVSLGIDLQTRIDGLLALHTVYASEGSQPGIRVYTDGAKPVPLAPATQTIEGQAVMGTPVLIVDRSPTGTTIVPTSATAATTVNLVNGDPATWLSGEGQTPVAITANGAPVATPEGAVTLTSDPAGSVVTLTGSQFQIRQLIGQATGVVVANAANDRTISTTSSVNVDLQGFTPALVASAFAAARLAEESIAGR